MKIFRKKEESAQRRQPNLMAGQNDYTFRRSRTLTGSSSSDIRSAVEDRTDLKSPRIKLHELKRHRRGVTGALLGVVLIVISLSWLLTQYIRTPEAIVYRNDSSLTEEPPDNSYLDSMDSYFAAHPLERFYFRLDKQRLNDFVASKHPEVSRLDVDDRLPGFYQIRLSLRQPVLSWAADSHKVYVDMTGAAFTANYFQPPKVSVEDRSGIELSSGTDILTSDRFVRFIGVVVGKINGSGQGIEVDKVIIPAGVTRQVQLQVRGEEYPIKTSIDRNPAAQAGDIVNALSYVRQKGLQPEYLDVRVAGRAYYR